MSTKNARGNVLVTGAARRIGRAICEALVARGYGVVIQYRASKASAEALVAALTDAGHRAWCVQSDLADQAACHATIATSLELAGDLCGLVNNASAFEKHAIGEVSEETLLGQLGINLFAPIYLTQAFRAACGEGSVVNLLDRRVAAHPSGCTPYLLSKVGLATFTQSAALELAPQIRVNGVAPGPVLPPPGEDHAYLLEHAGRVPLTDPPTPQDQADAVCFLMEARSVTGQIVYVDGGQHLLGNGADLS